MNQPTWRDRFDEKFVDKFYNIVNSELAYEELKYGEDTDVQELRDFIQSELSQQRKEIVEDVEKTVQKELETWARESIGAKAVESVQKALADIITKLSEEK